jgi:DNA polymerase-3 subunit delta
VARARGDDGGLSLLEAIESGDVAPVYCLHGPERYLIDRCVIALREQVLGGKVQAGLNLDLYELKESGIETVLASARTLPMFSKRRMVVGRGLEHLKADALERVVAYAKDPNPSSCLVLCAEKPDKVDGRLKGFQALKKAGVLHEFARLRDRELSGWIKGEARRVGLSIEPDAAEALAAAVGADLGRLAQALVQLGLYAAEPGRAAPARIRREHVEDLIPDSREREIFELTRAIGEGDTGRALALVGQLLRNREAPLRIQGSLLRQLRQTWRAKELVADGAPRDQIAASVGVPPFFLDQVLGPARRLSGKALYRGWEALYRADRLLKSSRVDPEILVTRLVRDLSDLR